MTGTTESVDFPTTAGADQTPGGGQDIFVTKFSPTGAVLYSTYLGGPCNDVAHGIAIDAAGNAYITGRVDQTNCYSGATPGALVAKLGPTGALVYFSTFGGALVETSTGLAIAVDAGGHAYVTGTTAAADFPTTQGAFQPVRCADVWSSLTADGFAIKLSADGSSLVYSTFLCGTGDDAPAGIAVDAAGNAYIAGTTGSHDFPTANPLQPSIGSSGVNGVTGFVSKLAPDGSHLIYSTYLGGSTRDLIKGLALDGQGNVYVTGMTQSTDYPTTAAVLQEHSRGNSSSMICGYAAICYSVFVTKIDASGSAMVYSTYLYGEADHGSSGIAVDAAGNAHVVGSTNSSYFPIRDAFQPANRGLDDAFIAKLSPDGTRLVYASYLGGSHVGPSSLTGSDVGLGHRARRRRQRLRCRGHPVVRFPDHAGRLPAGPRRRWPVRLLRHPVQRRFRGEDLREWIRPAAGSPHRREPDGRRARRDGDGRLGRALAAHRVRLRRPERAGLGEKRLPRLLVDRGNGEREPVRAASGESPARQL